MIWWQRHGRERAGVPINLDRPVGQRGRFRGFRQALDHDFIDKHSRTPEGDDVITSDAATHGDCDPRPRAAFWYGPSERHVITFPEGEEYEIIWLEGVALVKGYDYLGHLTSSFRVFLRNDNLSLVMAVNSGTCVNAEVQLLIEQLYELSWDRQQLVAADWFCTKCNWLADGISRGTIAPTSCDFMFDPSLFEALVASELRGYAPTRDGFANASGDNALCPDFCSLGTRNFFETDHRGIHTWINCDFANIGPTVQHWLKDKHRQPTGTSATVLVPRYKKYRPWLRLLRKHFELIKTFPKDSQLFLTVPAATEALAGRKFRPRGRRSVGPTRWPTEVWHCA